MEDNTSFRRSNPFESFWMAGYECTDQLNAFGNRVDFLKVTAHLSMVDQDYKDLASFSIKTVREGIRWSQVEKTPYIYDWSDVKILMIAAKASGLQQVWDICHFGFPDDLTPLHPMFARRFAALCRAFVKFYRSMDTVSEIIVTPINEVGFISWLGGDAAGTTPYCKRQGWEVKYALMKAYIEGIQAMKDIDPDIRIMPTEPLVNMVAPILATPEEHVAAVKNHEAQFQVLDILCGKMLPRVGWVNLNTWIFWDAIFITTTNGSHPHSNFFTGENDFNDPRWQPLNNLIKQLHDRYNCPVVLSETSHSRGRS